MYTVTIDIENCEACAECVDVCPTEVIEIVENDGKEYAQYTGDADDCLGCFSCEEVCEDGAITVTEM